MDISPIPKAVERLLHSIEAGHAATFLAALHADACVIDEGRAHRGAAIVEWAAAFLDRGPCRVKTLDPRWKSGEFHFKAQVEDEASGARALWRCILRIGDGRILLFDLSTRYQITLPDIAERFIEAVNHGDRETILSLFKEAAVVNDELVEYRGKPRIANWIDSNVIANRLGLIGVDLHMARHSITVSTHAFGDFPQDGLPTPLVLNLYFSIDDDQIEHLVLLQCPFASEPDLPKPAR
jgi:hypothetical protein